MKDIIDTHDMPTEYGSPIYTGHRPVSDAACVALTRKAGGVIMGKTVTTEFANRHPGKTTNPFDSRRTPGGSSSGSAAAVAAGLVPLAVGTDTGCSTRTPAALCGVVGLKPAAGTLPTTGVFPLSETLDHIGLLGAGINTVAGALSALTGHRIDPSVPVTGTVVGLPTDPYWLVHDPEISAAVDRAANTLQAAGAVLRKVRLSGIADLAATYPVIVGAEACTTHRNWLAQRPDDYQPATAARLRAAAAYTATDYIAAQRTRRRLTTELTARMIAEGIDVLLLATTPLRATPIGAREVDAPNGTRVAVIPALLSLTLPFNLLGWPAVSVPASGVTGLPAGIQVAAVRGGEQAVLAAGAQIMQVRCGEPSPDTPAPDRQHPR